MANTTDLNINVISQLKNPQQFLIYQQAETISVKNYKTAAWEHQYIAGGSNFNVVLPLKIQVGATASDPAHGGVMSTKLLRADYNSAFDVFKNGNALDIGQSQDTPATDSTITVFNKDFVTNHVVAYKQGKPLFAAEVRPDFKLSFAIKPKIYFALCDVELSGDFFDAATLTSNPVEIDYEGESNLSILLDENVSTGKITITYNFN